MKFEIYRDVGPSHLAPDGRLSVRSLVDFMQDCSVFQLDSERRLDEWFKANNAGMFLAHRQIHIVRMPVHGERMRVVTWVYKCNPMYGLRNTNMYDAEGNVCVYSCASGAFVDYGTGQLVRIPEDVLRTVPLYEPYPMEYMPRRVSVPKGVEAEAGEPMFVWCFLTDANMHVNNARYISVAQEYLPEGFGFSRIRVEYHIPAKYGETMYPKVYRAGEDTVTVALNNADGQHYAVTEFCREEGQRELVR